MPLTRKQFELGVNQETTDLMKKMHNFLLDHKYEAYNKEELFGILGIASQRKKARMERALQALVEAEAVEERIVNEKEYYAYLTPLVL